MPLFQAIPNPTSPISVAGSNVCRKKCTAIRVSSVSRHAHQVLDRIPQTDTFAWNSMIRTHLADGEPGEALSVYREMVVRGIRPDKHTLPRVLNAVSVAGDLFSAMQVHGHVLKHGFAADEYVVTALVATYGRFRGADAALEVFNGASTGNSVSWTQLMKLYLDEGKPDSALRVFRQMEALCVSIDAVALATALKACGMLKCVHEGHKLHDIARRDGLESDLLVSNSVLKMYVECGRVGECRGFFESLPSKDVVSWTTIIGAYVQSGEFNEGLKLFRAMCLGGMKPDSFAVTAILPACARMSACKHGREIHGYLIRHILNLSITVQNALMDMYIKSGCLVSATTIFEHLTERDLISWTIMILGYSLHGQGERGVKFFQMMEKYSGLLPDRTIFTAGLYACYTARLVEEGKFYFSCIQKPDIEHFILMVGLLARVGLFVEAQSFVMDNGICMNIGVLRALLDGCRIQKNIKLGKRIAEQLVELEPLNSENYTLLSNIHASNARWVTVSALRQTISDMGLRTKEAYSWIEVRRKIHVFGVGDISHPRYERIYWELQYLKNKMEEDGFVPEDDFSLHEIHKERECVLSGHSEMLAVAFGLISNSGKAAIRVTKNLRICQSCHSSVKMISKIVGREIILKDPYCFHHFEKGLCSCEDCW